MIRGDDPVAETVSINPWSSNEFSQGQARQSTGGGVSTAGQSSWGSAQMSWTPPNAWQTQPPQQPAWGGAAAVANSPTSSSSFTSYAEQTKKNVPVTGVVVGGSAASVISSGQPQQTRHPLSSNTSNTWASGSIKVDQHTPWDISSVPVPQAQSGGGGAAAASTAPSWGQPATETLLWQQQSQQQQQQDHSLMVSNGLLQQQTGSSDWSSQASVGPTHHIQCSQPTPPAHPHLTVPQQQQQQQRQQPPHYEATVHHHSNRNWTANSIHQGGWGATLAPTGEGATTTAIPIPIDPNPQVPGQWVAPQPSEMSSEDMMWHDPNPKQKKIQRDSGTAIWGDPTIQRGEIRRWKAGDDDEHDAASESIITSDGTTVAQLEWDASNNEGGAENGTSGAGNASAIVEGGWGEPPHQMGQSASNVGQWGSANSNWLPAVQHHHTSTGSDTKSPEMQGSFMPTDEGGTRQLVKVAIERGLITPSIVQRVFQNTRLVTQLRTLLQRLLKAEEELQKCRARKPSHLAGLNSDGDEDRLIYGIQSAKSDLLELQQSMGGINAMLGQPQSNSATLLHGGGREAPAAVQSRLQQWKNSPTDAGASSLINATQNLKIHTTTSDDWKSGMLDWSSPISGNPIARDANKMTESGATRHPHLGQLNGSAGTIFDDGPPEFVPGKRWEWRDPNKVAEDPNACPSMHKPNPLLAAAFTHTYSPSPTGSGTFQHSLASFSTPPQSAEFDAENGFSAYGKQPPLPFNSSPWSGYSPSQPGEGSWGKRHGEADGGSFTTAMPPPPSSGNPFVVPPPLTSHTGRMQQPYAAPPFCLPGGYWILFELGNLYSTQQLQSLCTRVGRLLNLLVVGHRIACAKFADVSIDIILQRIKLEYASARDGTHPIIEVKVVAEDEFQYMMQNSVRATPITVLWPSIQPQWNASAVSDQQPLSMGQAPPPHSSFTPTMPGNL